MAAKELPDFNHDARKLKVRRAKSEWINFFLYSSSFALRSLISQPANREMIYQIGNLFRLQSLSSREEQFDRPSRYFLELRDIEILKFARVAQAIIECVPKAVAISLRFRQGNAQPLAFDLQIAD